MKAKKFVCMFMLVIMIVSTSVGATSYDGSHIHSSEITEFALPGGGDTGIAQPMNVLCDLFGHADTEDVYTERFTQTMCVNVGDSYCEARCFVNSCCTRCGAVLSSRSLHVKKDFCIRRAVENAGNNEDVIKRIYNCEFCNPSGG